MISYEINTHDGYVTGTCVGSFHVDEFQRREIDLQSRADYSATFARLFDFRLAEDLLVSTSHLVDMVMWDLRDTKPGTSLSDLEEKSRFVVRSSESAKRSGKTAMLVNSHLMELMIQQMKQATNWRSESLIFRQYESALDWLLG